ncbi:hypothetical protein [Paracoccus laeviglucosivorans]|uniref:Uncharacterized protein n=1 Tax=Paracoccus laeviglucosivorans TaxID=1197861 RepID=A0A521E3X8_9RHOB|nr:hypothetical protein [Paracoccus laeviglucosivorans]SMO78555.1 hypothetical protein SAMN06265221_11132 [Paracoccus laeviglucosivorans]
MAGIGEAKRAISAALKKMVESQHDDRPLDAVSIAQVYGETDDELEELRNYIVAEAARLGYRAPIAP